jgi:uncharacterized membrane protein YbhN (UPF0104 family)
LLFWSLLVWFFGWLTNYLVFLSLGIPLSFQAAIVLLVILQIGVVVPSSSGRIGVFHYLTILGLSLFGISKEAAFGYAVILHLVVYGSIAILGVLGIWREKEAWSRFTRLSLRSTLRSIQTE